MTSVKPGTVISYDEHRARGVVRLVDDGKIEFGSTYFHSGRPTRDPIEGDRVEVVFSNDSVLYVRLRRAD